MASEFTIGYLARRTGCGATTIRYYERIGLLPPARRTEGATRLFGPAQLTRLIFIRKCREMDFSQAEIRELVALLDRPQTSCASVSAIARAHLGRIDDRIAMLTRLRGELAEMIGACGDGQVAECRIIGGLAEQPEFPA